MAIDFPNSPTTNQTFTSGGRTWIYNGSQWALQTGSYTAGTITTGSLAANSVTTAKVLDANITNAKLANSSVTIGSNTISLGGTVSAITGLANIAVANASVTSVLYSKAVIEPTTVSGSGASGTINLDFSNSAITMYQANSTANWTLNVRSNSGQSMNSLLANGDTATIIFMSTQGATGYWANVFQIDGSTVTPKWQAGATPTGGNTACIDIYSYTIIKTGSAAYTVLANLTKFA
jgi:hypothetical protein